MTARGLRLVVLLCALAAFALGAAAVSASAAAPYWRVTSLGRPTNFVPGDGTGNAAYVIMVSNTGDGPTDGSSVTIADTLPAGVSAASVEFYAPTGGSDRGGELCTTAPVQCIWSGVHGEPLPPLQPEQQIEMVVHVKIDAAAAGTLTNSVTVSGGGASATSASSANQVSSSPAPFGIQSFAVQAQKADGSPDARAGDHPYELTTELDFNTEENTLGVIRPTEEPKGVTIDLPAGLLGNPQAAPQCPLSTLWAQKCPQDSQIGTWVTYRGATEAAGSPLPGLIYNLTPQPGDVAELALTVDDAVPVAIITASVRTGGDYGLRLTNVGILQESVEAIALTIWGVPADSGHDRYRASCFDGNTFSGTCPSGAPLLPFLSNPTDCANGPLNVSASAVSWQHPGVLRSASVPLPAISGCEGLLFEPTIAVAPETSEAGQPAGLAVDLKVPQTDNPLLAATPQLRDAMVTMPEGLTLNPASAGGLQACSDAQLALAAPEPGACPEASKIGSVELHSPLLDHPLLGDIYLGMPQCSPCTSTDAAAGKMLPLFVQVDDPQSGLVIKLAGRISADPGSGQLTVTFQNNPELPFDRLRLQLKGGPRALLDNPPACGSFTTTSDLAPWSAPFSGPDATPSSTFQVTECGSAGEFSPSFAAGVANVQAGAYSPFVLSFSRSDSEQPLSSFSTTLPPGLLAKVAGIPLCTDADAQAGTCPGYSQVGTAQVGVGAGTEPLFLPGKVYLTGPYNGAPYGLAAVVPAIAGPFDLGTVVVRQALQIDPRNAQLTAVSDPLPSMLDGIPLNLRRVDVILSRPGFLVNPTSCAPTAVTGNITSTTGLGAAVSSHFQVGGCRELAFKPSLAASTRGNGSFGANGASLSVKIAAPGQGPRSSASAQGKANISKVDVQLPAALSVRLTTLQKACTERQFAADPAGCPTDSVVGAALIHTPLLPDPLAGPAYLVSHGKASFPDLVLVLQGDGVTIELTGLTQIRHGVTYTRFDTVLDAPISSFELTLPEGPYSALAANRNLCTGTRTVTLHEPLTRRVRGHTLHLIRSVRGQITPPLLMPTTIVGQNGAVLQQTTKVAVTGCRAPSERHKRRAHKKR